LEPSVSIDLELPSESVTFAQARELEALEPFGAGNARPVFVTKNLRCLAEPQVIKDRHLKMRLAGPQNRPLEAVWWNCIDSPGQTPELKGSIELAYTLETSAWNGDYRMQLNVLDLRCRN
jgi:single-stranded-DNA-specific exonuclease